MIYKFTVIQLAILCLCLPISSKDADISRRHGGPRILVLGAGMSGVSTAKALHDAGFKNIMILEATSRTGGRIKDTKLGNYTVELGAMWMYGKGSNPVYDMAERWNISFTDNFVDDWTVRDENGQDVTRTADIAYSKLTDAIVTTNTLTKESAADFTVLAGLRNSNWRPETEVDDVIESYLLDFETGVPPAALSLKQLHLKDTFHDFGSFDMMAVKHRQGFAEVVKNLRASFMTNDDPRIIFNKTVKVIQQDSDAVTVLTNDGTTFNADFAVVTFSLGVLQQREVKFSPPFPREKQLAIDMYGFCAFTHVYIQFSYTFWDETMYILRASKVRGHFSFWQNMNTIYPGCNILQLSLFGDEATWVDRSSDGVILQKALTVLQSLYPNISIPAPTGFKVSRWNTDPLTRGAFSYWPAGFKHENMRELQAPVGRIFFAGEHLDPLHYGFVHGAYRSGKRTAEALIRCMEHPSTCASSGDQMGQSEQCFDRTGNWLTSRDSFVALGLGIFVCNLVALFSYSRT